MKTEKIQNTPFTIVSEIDENDNKSYITIGNNILFVGQNEEECKIAIKKKNWELLINTASLIAVKSTEKYLEEKKEEKK